MVQRVTNVMVNLETIGSLAYNLTVTQSATKDMNVVGTGRTMCQKSGSALIMTLISIRKCNLMK